MRWIECVLPAGDDPDSLCMQLAELGVGGMVVEDEADFRNFLENNHRYWDYVDEELEQKFTGVSRVKFYLSDDDEGQEMLTVLRAAGFEPELAVVEDGDWENSWRAYYKPLPVGEKFLVIPAWEEANDPERVPLRLDPGLSFGTGSHATTQMCLRMIEKLAGPDKRVLDLGCGSGILGIGALLLGCRESVGCDIDPLVPDTARSNAALNDLQDDRFFVSAGDVLADKSLRARLGSGYDLVLANIVADVILPLTPLVPEFLGPGGRFVCSGIIEGRQDEIERVLIRNGFRILEKLHQDDWYCFCSEREEA